MYHTFRWDIFSSIFTALGSVATTGAVIFALHEFSFKTKERIKVSIADTYIDPEKPTMKYIGVNVINTGYLPIKISYIGFTSKRQKNKHSAIIFRPYSANYNQKIEIHDSGFYLLTERNKFVAEITEEINKERFRKNENIYICAVTPLKTHFTRTTLKFGKFYSQSEPLINSP